MPTQFDYAWEGGGLILTGSGNVSCFLQGEEAAELYDNLTGITRLDVLQAYLAEYAPNMRKD